MAARQRTKGHCGCAHNRQQLNGLDGNIISRFFKELGRIFLPEKLATFFRELEDKIKASPIAMGVLGVAAGMVLGPWIGAQVGGTVGAKAGATIGKISSAIAKKGVEKTIQDFVGDKIEDEQKKKIAEQIKKDYEELMATLTEQQKQALALSDTDALQCISQFKLDYYNPQINAAIDEKLKTLPPQMVLATIGQFIEAYKNRKVMEASAINPYLDFKFTPKMMLDLAVDYAGLTLQKVVDELAFYKAPQNTIQKIITLTPNIDGFIPYQEVYKLILPYVEAKKPKFDAWHATDILTKKLIYVLKQGSNTGALKMIALASVALMMIG